jgi:hypothetical protein
MALTRPRPAAPPRRSAIPALLHPRRLLVSLLLAALIFGLGLYLRTESATGTLVPRAALTAAPPPPVPPGTARVTVRSARSGAGASGKFAYATGFGPTLGGAGRVRQYRVAVELPAPAAVLADFAHEVDQTLGDPRSWIAGKQFRLRRVPLDTYAEFTVYLASARTSQRMCRRGGLETGGYTSCRLPRQAIINDSRWQSAVPRYGAPLATYRAYAINHEVGHQLGHGHEACPGKGRPAPVMMQQTYGLKGCLANPWPYPGGRRYAGPRVR